MTRCVISVAPEAKIGDVIARMITHQVSGMPVIDASGKLAGIVTEGDLLRRFETGTERTPRHAWLDLLRDPGRSAAEYARSHGRTVAEVMSSEVVTVREETELAEVVTLMEEHGVKRLPVLGEGERVLGIISRADLVAALGECLERPDAGDQGDEAIRRRLVTEMRRQTWCPLQSISVAVADGLVTLKGVIFAEHQREAMHALAEGVAGVKGILDQLVWIEPMSGIVVEDPGATGADASSTDRH